MVFTSFWTTLTILWASGEILKSKMADQDGRRSKMMTQFLRHVTSSAHYAGVKRNSFRRTIYPLSLVVIALMLLKSPPPHHKAQGRKKTPAK